jgi:putative spermidine/putrescine transport system permease protein
LIRALTCVSLAQLSPPAQSFPRTVQRESSTSLGASRAYTFRRVTLPLVTLCVAAGAFISFMSSSGNVPVLLFLRDALLPIRMWQDLEGPRREHRRRLDADGAVLMVEMGRLAGTSKRIR